MRRNTASSKGKLARSQASRERSAIIVLSAFRKEVFWRSHSKVTRHNGF